MAGTQLSLDAAKGPRCRRPDSQPKNVLDASKIWHTDGTQYEPNRDFLILWQAFFDRLRGKQFGNTAFVRFPLRLLTFQQLQRLAVALAAAELIRKESGLKGARFSMHGLLSAPNLARKMTLPPPECRVYTPPQLADAMVQAIDANPHDHWLDPCMGPGAFIACLRNKGVHKERIVGKFSSIVNTPKQRGRPRALNTFLDAMNSLRDVDEPADIRIGNSEEAKALRRLIDVQ